MSRDLIGSGNDRFGLNRGEVAISLRGVRDARPTRIHPKRTRERERARSARVTALVTGRDEPCSFPARCRRRASAAVRARINTWVADFDRAVRRRRRNATRGGRSARIAAATASERADTVHRDAPVPTPAPAASCARNIESWSSRSGGSAPGHGFVPREFVEARTRPRANARGDSTRRLSSASSHPSDASQAHQGCTPYSRLCRRRERITASQRPVPVEHSSYSSADAGLGANCAWRCVSTAPSAVDRRLDTRGGPPLPPRHARLSSQPSSDSQAKVRARAVGLLPRVVFVVVDARQHAPAVRRRAHTLSAIKASCSTAATAPSAIRGRRRPRRPPRAEPRRREDRRPEAHVACARPDLGLGRRPLVRVDGDDAGLANLPVQPRGPARTGADCFASRRSACRVIAADRARASGQARRARTTVRSGARPRRRRRRWPAPARRRRAAARPCRLHYRSRSTKIDQPLAEDRVRVLFAHKVRHAIDDGAD